MKCWNCGKEFEKFRFKDPWQNTCLSCIPIEYKTGKKQTQLKLEFDDVIYAKNERQIEKFEEFL